MCLPDTKEFMRQLERKMKNNSRVFFCAEFLLISGLEREWPRGFVHRIPVALTGVGPTTPPAAAARPVPIFLSYPPNRPLHSFSSYQSPSSRLSRSTVMAQPVYDQHPLQTYFTGPRHIQLPPQTPHLTRLFRRFTLTESERDIEVMPGGDYDDVDGLRPGKLPFASAVSWVLHVRKI